MPPAKKGAKKAPKKANKKAAKSVRSGSGDSVSRRLEKLERLVKKLVEETFPSGTPVG